MTLPLPHLIPDPAVQANFDELAKQIAAPSVLSGTAAGGDLSGTYPNPTVPAKLPVGGATGQVLTKNTGTDYDAGWATPTGGGGGAPSGPAGGDLTGTYPDPAIAAGVIVDADVNAAAAIAESKLNLATDAAAGTGSRRTLGTGATQAAAGNDARLTNARTPTAHATTHQPGGTDAMAVDAAAATGSLRTIGTGALQAAAGNDARLSDARTPTAHTHPAADVVSGVLATARLGSGTPAAGTYVDGGTGAWTTLPAVGAMTLDTWHAVGGSGEPAFTNSWVNFDAPGATARPAEFRKMPDGKVQLRGLVKTGASNTSVFTLPAGYRPPVQRIFLAEAGATGTAARVSVNADGTVVPVSAGGNVTTYVVLDEVEFDTDSVTTLFGWTAIPRQAADLTNATITLANTDLVFTFAANSTYLVDLYLLATSAATTTGYALAFDVSAAVTAVGLTFEHQLAAAGTLTGGDSIADAVARALSSGVPTAAALVPILGKGILVSGANTGTCRLQFAPEVAASATFKAGSTMRVMKAA